MALAQLRLDYVYRTSYLACTSPSLARSFAKASIDFKNSKTFCNSSFKL